jgi:UDP:flavonoid glycosyltransferase YjiC (YdhE family)
VDIEREIARILAQSRNWASGFIGVMRFTFSLVAQAYPDVLDLCREADLVVVSHFSAGGAEAAGTGLPFVGVMLQPQVLSEPDPSLPPTKRAVRVLERWAMRSMVTGPYNWVRCRAGTSAVRGIEGLMSSWLNLIPVSPLVVAPDPRWAPRHQVVGYWFLDQLLGWTPPADVEAFLDAGDPPVVVSLDNTVLGTAQGIETAQIVLDALRLAGVRAVVQGEDHAIAALDLPAMAHRAGPVPHSWLFDRARCVVHCGTYGTTAAGLRAGIPAVVVPHGVDQFYWGRRIYELGVGPQPIPRAGLSASKLADALVQAMQDDGMRARAARVGEKIRAETGVRTAVRLIEDSI